MPDDRFQASERDRVWAFAEADFFSPGDPVQRSLCLANNLPMMLMMPDDCDWTPFLERYREIMEDLMAAIVYIGPGPKYLDYFWSQIQSLRRLGDTL